MRMPGSDCSTCALQATIEYLRARIKRRQPQPEPSTFIPDDPKADPAQSVCSKPTLPSSQEVPTMEEKMGVEEASSTIRIDPFKPYRNPGIEGIQMREQRDVGSSIGGKTITKQPGYGMSNPLAFGASRSAGAFDSAFKSKNRNKKKKKKKTRNSEIGDGGSTSKLPQYLDPHNLINPLNPDDQEVRTSRTSSRVPLDSVAQAVQDDDLVAYTKMPCAGSVVEEDIVWYLGGRTGDGFIWNPHDQILGGSEQAVVELSRAWVEQGFKVAVYGPFEDQEYAGVSYFRTDRFRGDAKYNTLILWRAVGSLAGITRNQLCAQNLVHEVQDSYLYPVISSANICLLTF